jgi:type II secretory pathway component PulC
MMTMLRSITRNVTLLNLLLSAALVLACISIIVPAMRMTYRLKLPRIVSKEGVPQEKPVQGTTAPLPTDYAVIGETNLFHPQRMIPIDTKKELPKPELFLCGIIHYGNELVAFVEDKKNPTTSPGRGKRQTVLRKGTVYAGYSVTGINKDSIVLTRGEQSVAVHLMDSGKRGGKNAPPAVPDTTRPSTPQASPSPVPPGSSSPRRQPTGQPQSEGDRTSQHTTPGPPHHR